MRTNWLTDLLPGKVANARIMSFAYNANTFADQSKGEIMDHAVALLDYLDMKRDGIQVCLPSLPCEEMRIDNLSAGILSYHIYCS
jgi:hypothetical protein